VDDKFVGLAVQCHQCRQAFRVADPTGKTAAVVAAAAGAGTAWLDIGAATSVGRVRKRNEDSFLVLRQNWASIGEQHEVALLVVADGMGGYDAGDQASRLAIQSLGSSLVPFLTALCSEWRDPATMGVEVSLGLAIQEANGVVYEASRATPACKGMGATAVIALLFDNRVHIAHVGDCRAYRLHGPELAQITRDQTLVARMIELGQLTPREAEGHPQSNEVSQALGKRADIEPGHYQLSLERDDWLILACDGLHTDVDVQTLPTRIRQQPTSAQEVSSRLVSLATQQGGRDNCTVVAVHYL
jgi:protein phosphatase